MRNILFLIAIYVIYRLVRVLLRSKVVIKTYHYHDHRPQEIKKEGEVKITRLDGKPDRKPNTSSGDYVDYEEVK